MEPFNSFLSLLITSIGLAVGFLWANRQPAVDLKEIETLSEVRVKYTDAADSSVSVEIDKRIKALLARRDKKLSDGKTARKYKTVFWVSGALFLLASGLSVWFALSLDSTKAWPTIGLVASYAVLPISGLVAFWCLRQANK